MVLVVGLMGWGAVEAKAQGGVPATEAERLMVRDYRHLGLSVSVRHGGLEEEYASMTTEDVRTKVELRMRRAGIPPEEGKGSQVLHVDLHTYGKAFNIRVSLWQTLTWALPNETVMMAGVGTWATNALGQGESRAEVLSTIEDEVYRFLNAYLKANQGEGK